jgi:hypothetical protein
VCAPVWYLEVGRAVILPRFHNRPAASGPTLLLALFINCLVKVFSEVGPSGYFQKAPAYSSTTCFRVSSISKEKRTMPLSLPLHSK